MPQSADMKKQGNSAFMNKPNDSETDPGMSTDRINVDNVLAEMEKALDDVASVNPRMGEDAEDSIARLDDIRAVLEISLAINSSLVLEEILQVVMQKAVELLSAERGFIMLLDSQGRLQFKSAHNIRKEETSDAYFKISNSIANRVAQTGKSVYTSDAQEDERYAKQQSVVELHLRSIMCVPLKIKSTVIGIVYLDNSSQAKLFLKSDLILFELFAQQAAIAIHNAQLYTRLSRLKQYNEDIIAQSPVGLIVIDSDYHLVTANEASLAIFQINKDEVRLGASGGRNSKLFDLLPESQHGRWRTMIDNAMGNPQGLSEDRYFHNTGFDEKVLSIKITPTDSLPGPKSGAILVIEDITEKVILEKYVILSEKLVAKGEMAASIGHELNNYLTIISNNAELMDINVKRNQIEKARENSQQVVENISKMKRFTDGLMDFSKLETEMVSYDIKHLVENLLFSLRTQRKFRGVTIEQSFDSGLPDLNIDVGQIQQVLLNLLNNAADAMEGVKNPHIMISCSYDSDRDMVEVKVSDNGRGMSDDIQGKIFQSHFTTKPNGHGLGLSNSRKIILNHGGEISVASAPGQGTTFTILLPRHAE